MPTPTVEETSAMPVSCHLPMLALLYHTQFVVPLLESFQAFPLNPAWKFSFLKLP